MRIIYRLLFSFIFFLSLFFVFFSRVLASSYYVDATGGNDSNSGISQNAPWQTVSKINSFTFTSGDKLYFKRGETWILTDSLNASDGVTYSAYGEGNRPILDGNNVTNVFVASGKNGVTIQNLEVKNALDYGVAFGKVGATPASNGTIYDLVVSHSGNDNILIIDGSHDITVTSVVTYNAYLRVSDGRLVTNLEIADDAYNVTVDAVTSYGSAAVGISIHAHTGEGFPHDITVRNSSFYSNSTAGVYMISNSAVIPADPNILLENCDSYNNSDGASSGYGLVITNDGGLTYVTDVTFKNFKSYGNNADSIYVKGDSLVFNNCLMSGRSPSIVSSIGVTIYNCTVYNTASIAAIRISGARMANFVMKNTIIRQTIAGQVGINVILGAGTAGFDINYNLYKTTGTEANTHWSWLGTNYNWANWKLTSGMDANSPTPADPLFVDAISSDFTLQSLSPARDIGVDVGLAYAGSGPDMGAYEYSLPDAPTSLTQYKSDESSLSDGGSLNIGSSVILKFYMSASNSIYSLTPQFEVRGIGDAFTNSPNYTGSTVSYTGTAVLGTVTIEGLGSGGYHWQARTSNSAGQGSWVSYGSNAETNPDLSIEFGQSSTSSCNDTTPASAPWLFGVISKGTDSILLQFSEVKDNISGYVIEYGTASGIYQYAASINGKASDYLISSLSPATKYFFRVRGVNGCGVGPWSNEASITSLSLSPRATSTTTARKNEIKTQDEEEEKEETVVGGISLKIKIVDENGNPIKGAIVTLHSTPMEATTDENGIAYFEKVEPGDHKAIVSYNGKVGEQEIKVEEGKEDINFTIELKAQSPFLKKSVMGVISLLALFLLATTFLLIKKMKS